MPEPGSQSRNKRATYEADAAGASWDLREAAAPEAADISAGEVVWSYEQVQEQEELVEVASKEEAAPVKTIYDDWDEDDIALLAPVYT